MLNAKLLLRTASFGAILLTIAAGSAGAQTANLSCSGTLRVYEPERFDASVAPTSSVVDLAGQKITTPLGTYAIDSVHESGIMFGSPPSPNFNFVTFGSLDRLTGKMLISWMTSEQHAKLQAGQTAHASRSAELICVAAQRLF